MRVPQQHLNRRQFIETAAGLAGAGLLGRPATATALQPAPSPEDLSFESALVAAQRIRNGDVSSVELTEHIIARIEKHDETLNAIVVQIFDQARTRAKAADVALAGGERWGPFHGVPVTVKESFDLAGLPTTAGVPGLVGNLAASNANVVERLEGAGAVILGKTNVPFMLGDHQSYNQIYGTTNNPWDLERTPGGSTGGGAAALAAGLSYLSIGSDIGGSIHN